MKVITFLFFATIAVISSLPGFSDKVCSDYFRTTDEDHQAFSKDFCRTLGLTDNGDKCCYMRYKTNDGANYYNCIQVTMEEFYNIKDYKKALETNNSWDIKSIECDSSSYLYGSLLLLLVFLF